MTEQLELFAPRDTRPDPRREEIIAAMMTKERWRTDEVAYFLRRSEQHVMNLVDVGELDAKNDAADTRLRSAFIFFRDNVLSFDLRRSNFPVTFSNLRWLRESYAQRRPLDFTRLPDKTEARASAPSAPPG